MAELSASARIEVANVRDILDTNLTDAQLHAYMNAANLTVTNVLGSANLGAETLAAIELWLSAHYAATVDKRPESEKIGDEYQVKYEGKTGMGLKATLYGQQALALDPTGKLAEFGAKQSATLRVTSTSDGQNMRNRQ